MGRVETRASSLGNHNGRVWNLAGIEGYPPPPISSLSSPLRATGSIGPSIQTVRSRYPGTNRLNAKVTVHLRRAGIPRLLHLRTSVSKKPPLADARGSETLANSRVSSQSCDRQGTVGRLFRHALRDRRFEKFPVGWSIVNRFRQSFAPHTRQARFTRIHGAVRMVAEIDEGGAVASLVIESGHPFPIAAALDAAQRYRYRPGTANGVRRGSLFRSLASSRRKSRPLKSC